MLYDEFCHAAAARGVAYWNAQPLTRRLVRPAHGDDFCVVECHGFGHSGAPMGIRELSATAPNTVGGLKSAGSLARITPDPSGAIPAVINAVAGMVRVTAAAVRYMSGSRILTCDPHPGWRFGLRRTRCNNNCRRGGEC